MEPSGIGLVALQKGSYPHREKVKKQQPEIWVRALRTPAASALSLDLWWLCLQIYHLLWDHRAPTKEASSRPENILPTQPHLIHMEMGWVQEAKLAYDQAELSLLTRGA